jgi:replicative DNA helicase
MNINAVALKQILLDENSKVNPEYLKEDYKLLAEKVKQFYEAKGKLPTPLMLKAKSKSFGKDLGEGDRLHKIAESLINLEVEYNDSEICDLVLDDYKKRKILEITEGIMEATISEDWNEIGNLNDELQRIKGLSNDMDTFLMDDAKGLVSLLDGKFSKTSTGILWGEENAMTHVAKGSIELLIARSGEGKTLLGIQETATHFFLENKNCLVVSYELPLVQVLNRFKANISGVPLSEINDNEYLLEESKDKMAVIDYVFKKQILLNDAVELYKKKGIKALEELPDRKNILKIIASQDAETFKLAKEQGKKITDLPNDKELINIINTYGDTLDVVLCDYISEVPFSNAKLSREESITNLSRELKLLSLKYGLNIKLLSQCEAEKDAFGIFEPKYAKSLINISDLVLVVCATSDMKESDEICVSTRKARHGKPFISYVFEADYSCQRFIPCDDSFSMWDLQSDLKKDFSKNKKK